MTTPPTEPIDRCDSCGFDGSEWNDADSANTIVLAPTLFRLWSSPMDDEVLNRRPRPSTWSVAEYIDHVREVFFGMRFLIELSQQEPGKDLGPAPQPAEPGEQQIIDVESALSQVGAEAKSLGRLLVKMHEGGWGDGVVLGESLHTVRWASRHAVHDLWHHLIDVAHIRTDLGFGPAAQSGVVSQISASDGGVPKQAVAQAEIGRRGVVGDRQQARRHHGRPWQALCLWSDEVIAELADEGHEIRAGAAGENVTLRGIDWSVLQAGSIIDLGEVVVQVSAPAVPCSKNNQWFADNDSSRIDHDLHPGFSRWYASVLRPGSLAVGDQAVLSAPRF